MSSCKLFFLFITIIICNHTELHAQNAVPKTHRILILLDGSHYMSHFNDNGRSYFTNAAEFITHLIDSSYIVNEDLEYGLRVYGHQYNENDNRCNDSRLEVRFTKDNLAQISLRLRDLKPKGNGNAAYAIQQAYQNEMVDTQRYWYSIIWITADTGKCYTDPCAYIQQTIKNDLYKLFNIRLAGAANKTANCFEPVYIVNPEDEIHAIASIIPYYKKDKKAEAYWDVVNRQKPKQTYLPLTKPSVTQPIDRQKRDTIITLTPKIASSVSSAKKDLIPTIDKTIIPAFTPTIAQQFNDSVTLLNTLQTRSVELKIRLTRVKAGTIAVPVFFVPLQRDSVALLTTATTKSAKLNAQPITINTGKYTPPKFIPPVAAQSRDSVTLINSLGTKQGLNGKSEKIVIAKATIPAYHPPVPVKVNDSVGLLNTLPTKVYPILMKTTITTHRVKIPEFSPPVPTQLRDSVAILSSLTTKAQTKKLTNPTFTPTAAIIPAFALPRQTDEMMAISTKPKPISVPPQPIIKPFSKIKVPEFYVLSLPGEVPDNQTEMPPEPPIEEIVDADAVPAIVFGNLNVKSFGATVRVQVYRIKLGEDILVSDNSFSGPKQIRIKLEPGRYKLRYNLNDGTEVTKPFLIDEDTDTDINVK